MCAGYGGIGLGLKNIFGERMRTLAYCELEGFAQANLISKMEKGLMDVAPLWNDLKTFPYESFHGLVDILIAGYPCQPFSAAGKRAGKEDPRHLWPWIADGIRLLRPRMCFFENVEGHISLGLREVVGELESMGYKVSWGIFSAREVGAPHQRKRVFILADRICDGYDWRELQDRVERWSSGELPQPHAGEPCGVWSEASGCGQVWPSRPGQQQYAWEPPRVVGNAESKQGTPRDHRGESAATSDTQQVKSGGGDCGALRENNWQTQSPLGRDSDGSSDRMDYAELYTTYDNRTDELRLLGNGVVPATAERAFRILKGK